MSWRMHATRDTWMDHEKAIFLGINALAFLGWTDMYLKSTGFSLVKGMSTQANVKLMKKDEIVDIPTNKKMKSSKEKWILMNPRFQSTNVTSGVLYIVASNSRQMITLK